MEDDRGGVIDLEEDVVSRVQAQQVAEDRPDRAAVGDGQDRVGRVRMPGGRRTGGRARGIRQGFRRRERRSRTRRPPSDRPAPAPRPSGPRSGGSPSGRSRSPAGRGRSRRPRRRPSPRPSAGIAPAGCNSIGPGQAAGCWRARARACSRPAASRGGSVAPISRPTYSAPGRACRTKTRRWAIVRVPNKKSPSLEEAGPCNGCNLDLPSKERGEAPSGILTSESSYLPRPSHPTVRTVAILCGVRHRLQWRGRAGFSPASQFQRNSFRIGEGGGSCQEGARQRAGGVSLRTASSRRNGDGGRQRAAGFIPAEGLRKSPVRGGLIVAPVGEVAPTKRAEMVPLRLGLQRRRRRCRFAGRNRKSVPAPQGLQVREFLG